jgi:hypothetical protein
MFIYVGDSGGFKTSKIPLITIGDLHLTSFSDMFIGYRILIEKIIPYGTKRRHYNIS